MNSVEIKRKMREKTKKKRGKRGRKIQRPVSLRLLNDENSTDQGVSWPTLQEVGVLSYSGYCLSKGHSMAMRYSLNSEASSKTILIKLFMI